MGRSVKIRLLKDSVLVESDRSTIEELSHSLQETETQRKGLKWMLVYKGEIEDVLDVLERIGLEEKNIEVVEERIGFKEFLKSLKRRHKGTLICPICGSKNVVLMPFTGWLLPSTYMCKDCGYIGHLVVEVDEE